MGCAAQNDILVIVPAVFSEQLIFFHGSGSWLVNCYFDTFAGVNKTCMLNGNFCASMESIYTTLPYTPSSGLLRRLINRH